MYRWRKMTQEERSQTFRWRQELKRPIHSPHHFDSGQCHYLITAACFQHALHVGHSIDRMNTFAESWLEVLHEHCNGVTAWVVLPNHYHALVSTGQIKVLLKALGLLHGRTSHTWNGEENTRRRKIWLNATETVMKSTGHFHATVNYVHHNPVKHRYVSKWTDWPWSSASEYLKEIGRKEAERLWNAYPIDRYGEGWDDPDL